MIYRIIDTNDHYDNWRVVPIDYYFLHDLYVHVRDINTGFEVTIHCDNLILV